jgi:hypothetical protein
MNAEIRCDHPALRYGNKGDAVRFRRNRLDAEWRVGLIRKVHAIRGGICISVQLLDGRVSVFPAFGDEIELLSDLMLAPTSEGEPK